MNARTNRLVNLVVAAALALLGVSLAALLATPPLLGGPVDPTGGSAGAGVRLLRLLAWSAAVVAALAGGYVLYRAVASHDDGPGEST